MEAAADQLANRRMSDAVNISFVERDNLREQQSNSRLTRRSKRFPKQMPSFGKQLWLSTANYHLVLPHHSLREPLEIPDPMRGISTARKRKPGTP
jgi:hypothetical protein